MTELFHQFELQILAIIGTLIAAAIKYRSRPRSRLVYSSPHSSNFLVQPDPAKPKLKISTTSIWVQNTGREPATEVEFTFNYKPQNYNLWPPRSFETIDSPDNRHTLKFSNIAPKVFRAQETKRIFDMNLLPCSVTLSPKPS